MFAGYDIEKGRIEHIVSLFGIVAYHHILELLELWVDMGMVGGEFADIETVGRGEAFQKIFHIGKYASVFRVHMPRNFGHIVVVKAENEESEPVGARSVDGVDQFAANQRQNEIEKICVGIFQICHQRRQLYEGMIGRAAAHKVCHGEKRRAVEPVVGTDLFYEFIAESERDAEAREHHQEGGIGRYQRPHGGLWGEWCWI